MAHNPFVSYLRFWWVFSGFFVVMGLLYAFKDWLLAYARENTYTVLIGVAVLIVLILVFC